MPIDGAGNFTRNYNWVTDAANGLKIQSARMDGEFDNYAAAFNTTFWRDGRTGMTGNLNMNGFKVTNANLGSTAACAFSFTGTNGQNTGMYSPSFGEVALVSNGTERLKANSAGLLLTADTISQAGNNLAIGSSSILPYIDLTKNTVVTWRLGNFAAGANTDFSIGFNATEVIKCDGSGLVSLLQGRLKFPAIQNPSADPNTLDDYEEGAWTPSVLTGGAAVGRTYSTLTGSYTKVGNVVTACWAIVMSAKGSSVGALSIGGLPFVPQFTSASAAILSGALAAPKACIGTTNTSSAIDVWNQAGNVTQLTDADLTNTTQLYGSITYLAQ